MAICQAHRTDGQPCKAQAMRGQKVCVTHGGAAPQARAAAKRRLAELEVRAELERLGIPVEVDPVDALLSQLAEAAGNVAYLRGELQRRQQLAVEVGEPSSAPLTWRGVHTQGVAPLVSLYNEERDRVARIARVALDAGVNERAIALAERLGAALEEALSAALEDDEWQLTDRQRQQGRLVLGRHLKAAG